MPSVPPIAHRRGPAVNLTLRQAIQRAIAAYQQGELGTAERLCRAVLGAKASDFDALHLLGVIATQTRRTQEAIELLSKAVSVNPNNAQAYNDHGNALQDVGQLDAAVASYRRALELKPYLADAHNNLGNALQKLGQFDDAMARYRRAIAIKPDFALAYNNLGSALRKIGRLDDALANYRTAAQIKPDLAMAHYNQAGTLKDLGKIDGAVASYRRALEINPHFDMAHSGLGDVLKELGQLDDAVASYRRALDINRESADAHNSLGTALLDLTQLDDAVASFRRALEIKPDFAEAHSNLGTALRELGRLDDAVASCRRALEIKPDFAAAHNNLGNALNDLARPDDAVASYRRALEINPCLAEVYNNLGNALGHLGRLDEAAASCRQALEVNPNFAHACSNLLFCLSHNPLISSQTLFAEHCHFGEQFEPPLRPGWPLHRNARDPARRLKIGLVSADLRDHAVAHFIEPLLPHLAASSGLSIHAYHNHAVEDGFSARQRDHIQQWHRIAGLSDLAAAQKIGDDGIDILIDLSGHTGENRLLIFARKPAPVQASWIGYPGTTGLSAMDYYLSDRNLLPPGRFDTQFTEKIVYLPASVPFLPSDQAPQVNSLPALSNGHVTFGSFNRLIKLGPSEIALWSPLQRALPDARMVLGGMPPEGQSNPLIDWFAQEGIARERLSFYPRCKTAAYLSLHHQVDMCLDTFPYTGGTTTNHALWMGVPTLTLAGPTPPGRQGAAVLGHVGLEAFVAQSVADFQEKGLFWAGNLGALAEVRAELRGRYERSPLRHPDAIAAGLESALRRMWQRWCAGLPPESIDMSRTTETSPSVGIGDG
jgi:protein O-GlcNAc transferase